MATLTVVMPAHNEALRAAAAVERVFNQTRQPDAVIVVNDGSTDETAIVLAALEARFAPTLRVITHATNLGCHAAIQNGVRQADTTHICSSAMDDGITPRFIETSMAMLEIYPEAGLCCSDVELRIEGRSSFMRAGLCTSPKYFTPDDLAKTLNGGFIFGASSIYRRDYLAASGMFDGDLRWHGDWFSSLVIALRHGACFIPETNAFATIRNDLLSHSGRGDWSQQSKVIEHIFRLLNSEQYDDVLDGFIKGKAMNHFGDETIRLLNDRPDLDSITNRLLAFDTFSRGIWEATPQQQEIK